MTTASIGASPVWYSPIVESSIPAMSEEDSEASFLRRLGYDDLDIEEFRKGLQKQEPTFVLPRFQELKMEVYEGDQLSRDSFDDSNAKKIVLSILEILSEARNSEGKIAFNVVNGINELEQIDLTADGVSITGFKRAPVEFTSDHFSEQFERLKSCLRLVPNIGNNIGFILTAKRQGIEEKRQKMKFEKVCAVQRTLWEEAESLSLEWTSEAIVPGELNHFHFKGKLFGQTQNINFIEFVQPQQTPGKPSNLAMLFSKISEAMRPNRYLNHLGAGWPILDISKKQPGCRLIINGGYSHYKHGYYPWGTDYHIGDPAVFTKIREHQWGAFPDEEFGSSFGFLVQKSKDQPFQIVTYSEMREMGTEAKYILTCSPPLIFNHQPVPLESIHAYPLKKGEVNPPSNLGHLFKRNPRTAIGIRETGELVFVTVDGRGENAGMNFPELVALMHGLGVRDALNLDGGGCTALYLQKDGQEGGIVNQVPEEDANRDIGNAIIIFDESLK